MTQKERKNPKLLNASRKRRIATGSGVDVQDVNRLLKQHQDMETIMKRMKKLGMSGLMKAGLKGLFNMK
jgi:signal recognition particle subunit SRP54